LSLENAGGEEKTNYPLVIVASPANQLGIRLSYDGDLFEASTVERMAGHLEMLLRGMVADPERPLRELDLLNGGERRQLQEWSRVRGEYAHGPSVVEQFEEQARRRPGAEAVVCGSERLSYGELNRRANRLAHRLRGL